MKKTVVVIGCGAIGSRLSLELVRTNLIGQIVLYDFDTISKDNLTNQIWMTSEIGQYKVVALKRRIHFINPNSEFKVLAVDAPFEKGSYLTYGASIFSCVDSMRVRKDIWESIDDSQSFFDCRIDFDSFRVYSCKKPNAEYEKTLYLDSSSVPDTNGRTICGSRIYSTIPQIATAQMISLFLSDSPPIEIMGGLSESGIFSSEFHSLE